MSLYTGKNQGLYVLPSISTFHSLTPSPGALGKSFNMLVFFCVSPGETVFFFISNLKCVQCIWCAKIATQKDCQYLPNQCLQCWASGILFFVGFWYFAFFVVVVVGGWLFFLLGWGFLRGGCLFCCCVCFF